MIIYFETQVLYGTDRHFIYLMLATTTTPFPHTELKFAQFNAALAVDNDPTENYQRWVDYMSIPLEEQNQLITKWKNQTDTPEEHKLAERVIQIRNIAAIIQKNRPDVLLLNEFNNNGYGQDMRALDGFQKNLSRHFTKFKQCRWW